MLVHEFDLPNNRGKRLTVEDQGTETIRADLPKTVPSMTVYWHGRVDRNKLLSFFLEGCPPPIAKREFTALVFRLDERLRLGAFNNVMALERNVRDLPADASFVRLEHTSAEAVEPDFIVWARVDLGDAQTSTQPVPDYIGVAAEHDALAGIRPLAASTSCGS